MTFFQKDNPHRLYLFTWWLSIVTLPWSIAVSGASLVLLALAWIGEGGFVEKWKKLVASKWIIPFLSFYLIHVVGLLYSSDLENGLFALEKKVTFLLLPVIAASGTTLDERSMQFLKRSFVYSCLSLTMLSVIMAFLHFLNGQPAGNFDITTLTNFNQLHPQSSPLWMHFSYIQLGEWAAIHPAYFSLYLIFCLVLLFTEKFQTPLQRTLHFLMACFMIAFIALMASRMAIIALVAAMAYLILNGLKEKKPRAIISVLVAITFLSGLVWHNPVSRFRVIEEPLNTSMIINENTTDWNSFNYRLLEWRGACSIINQHVFAGVGTGGSDLAMKDFYTHFNKSTMGITYNPHNQYLQTWIELGLFGLASLVACFFIGLWQGPKQPGYIVFIIIFSLMCFTESILERQKGIVFFTLFQSLYLSFERQSK